MDYEELRKRCIHVMNLHPDSKESVDDCYVIARRMFGGERQAYLEILASLFNEFIRSHHAAPGASPEKSKSEGK